MRKKIIYLLLLGTLGLALIGCESTSGDSVNRVAISNSSNRFMATGDEFKIGILRYETYYDSKTNIVYISDAIVHNSGITIMYDSDGKPMVLSNYNKTKANDDNRFIAIGDEYKIGILRYETYYDSKTNIVYIADAIVHNSGISVMYDIDGKPMTLANYNKTK